MNASESSQIIPDGRVNHFWNRYMPRWRKKYNNWCICVLVVFLVLVIVLCIFIILNLVHNVVQSPCDRYEFQCVNSTKCIPSNHLCNGKRDCSDSSDETLQACKGVSCLNDQFQCKYGACIPASSKCNGVPDCVDNSDEENCNISRSFENISNNCSEHHFQCIADGKCIHNSKVCDGSVDCKGGDDETKLSCFNRYCPPELFKCEYGACVNKSSICDKISDCADKSDENPDLCGYHTTISTKEPKPKNSSDSNLPCLVDSSKTVRVYFEANVEQEIQMESYVETNTSVIYKCKSDGILDRNITNVCRGGKWIANHPKCKRLCSSLPIIRYDVITTCSMYGKTIPCGHELQHETVANLKCAFGYEGADGSDEGTMSCEDGKWIPPPFKCIQICGLDDAKDAVPLIIGGAKVNITAEPWMINIRYRNQSDDDFEHICSGIIINAKQFVTAAHCLYSESDHKMKDLSQFQVGAGTVLRDFSTDLNAQIHYFAHIDYSLEYDGIDGFYAYDFAVVTIRGYFIFNIRVRPVCIDTSLKYDQRYVKPNTTGTAAGWGLTAYYGGIKSPELKSVNLTTIGIVECRKKVSPELRPYVNSGPKICLANSYDKGLWQGDSGGGFTIESEVNGKVRRFLVGIISLSGQKRKYYSDNEYTLLTNVLFYADVIDKSQQRLLGILH